VAALIISKGTVKEILVEACLKARLRSQQANHERLFCAIKPHHICDAAILS